MPTYGKENFKESNVNYLNKDFASLKQSLVNYAKSYFPDTYRDFNETSPGMMLIEMNAYVGDVLSFYIDQQYREMLLPLAEERRNIITMAKMLGYKVKPIVASYVDLTFTSDVNSNQPDDASTVDYTHASTFDPGIEIESSTNSDNIFTTLEPIDFRIEKGDDTNVVGTTLESGLAETYTLSRTVRAVSATEKTISFQVGTPEKFKTLTIPDKNVIDIVSCIDSNGSNWYEVDFLAQDKVPIETHYTDDENRESAFYDEQGLESTTAVPYSLTYITTPKRFTRETNVDNTTSLIFGNGVLKNGLDGTIDQGYIDMEQVGITTTGQSDNLNNSINSLLGNEYSTLGETPNNTTLTITYRVGGGIESNVPSGDLSTLPTTVTPAVNGGATLTSVTNERPARGGKDEEDTIEIREKAKAFFSTQNRCVTKEDYEARVLNIPAKFGNIAKVVVVQSTSDSELGTLSNIISFDDISGFLESAELAIEGDTDSLLGDSNNHQLQYVKNRVDEIQDELDAGDLDGLQTILSTLKYNLFQVPGRRVYDKIVEVQNRLQDIRQVEVFGANLQSYINIFVLGYNNSKQLVGNPFANQLGQTDNLPNTLLGNISTYLENFRIMTDLISLKDGYIVNFGVIFDVIAEKYANKQQVKLDCIQKIKEYFRIEKMQFNQPIYKSNLEFELMGVEGVRSIGHVTITQDYDYFYVDEFNQPTGEGESLERPTFSYSYNQSEEFELSEDSGYGYKYNFQFSLSDDKTIILPPNQSTPAVFELKNPNQNIQGRVR